MYDDEDTAENEDTAEDTTDEQLFDQDVEAPDAKPPDWEAAAKKARREAHSLRARLRRTEIELNYGKEVASLIPDELPINKWEAFADIVAGRLPEPAAEPTDRPEGEDVAPPTEPTLEELRLAAIVATGNSGYGGTAYVPTMTAKEIMELGKQNPGAAEKQIRQQYRNQP